jgi:hypothetical protein
MYTLIDGDVIVYSCGFSSQKNEYTCDGVEVFQYKKDATAYALANDISVSRITKTIDASPVSHALQNVKQSLFSIAEACDSNDGKIYLTGKGNYRHDVATSHVYKGNRDPEHKPVHYDAIIDYLIKHWDAEIVEGMEADDAMGIAQYSQGLEKLGDKRSIICTIDKDLDMIPGWHYNFRRGVKYFTTLKESNFFFYKQMLTGDRVDNIIGIKGIGEKTAHKLLVNKSPEQMESIILKKYRSEFKNEAWDRYNENKKLLWILREPI